MLFAQAGEQQLLSGGNPVDPDSVAIQLCKCVARMPGFVVVGGGIAAVQCVEELARLCPNDAVTLVSATNRIKASTEIAIHKPSQALHL